MPYETINGTRLHYTDTGGDGDVVLFAHGLCWSGRMFSAQQKQLSPSYRCVTMDFRGQGKSDAPPAGYDMDSLTADVAELIRRLDLGRVHLVGLSMGGFVGMRLAARHPELIRTLSLLNTSAEAERLGKRMKYRLLSLAVLCAGVHPVSSTAMRIMFGKTFLNDDTRSGERKFWRQELLSNNRRGIVRAIQGVVNRPPITPELGRIQAPTLILVGEEDAATPPARGRVIADAIANGCLRSVPECGHTSTIEQPIEVSRLLAEFFASAGPNLSTQD